MVLMKSCSKCAESFVIDDYVRVNDICNIERILVTRLFSFLNGFELIRKKWSIFFSVSSLCVAYKSLAKSFTNLVRI